jgi:glycosyltransferase involved in cell wall biosynthesis
MQRKVAFIASYPESLINFRLHLIKEFLARDFSVIAIAPYDKNVIDKLAEIGVEYIPLSVERNGKNPFHDIVFLIRLIGILRKQKPYLTFSYTIKPVIYGTLAARLANVPQIFAMLTGTGYVFSKMNLKSRCIGWVAKALLRFSLRFNKKLFFQNKDNLAEFSQEKLISSHQPVAIINGSGVDINIFKKVDLPEKISFLMIARLLVDKGVREYVEAARAIKKRYPQVTFKLVGWRDTNPHSISENELREWINSGVIDYLGKLADVRGAIAESSVYVLPSYGEGTPRTVLEAMAMGRPIITTDVPGCRETVIDGKNGFLVPPQNVTVLSEKMAYFLDFPQQIQLMGEASRLMVVDKYDVNKVNQRILMEMQILHENPTRMAFEDQI